MIVYFITRFSICDPGFKGFRIAADYVPLEYEQRLFDQARMDYKFEIFKTITMPSIVGQSCDRWKWLIGISDRMPEKYLHRLRDLVQDHPGIVLIPVPDFRAFFRMTASYDYGPCFATVRIDDDDGLNHAFVQSLQQYSNQVGSIVSFTQGSLIKYVKGELKIGAKVSARNNALGLAAIGLDIFHCGIHSTVHERYKVIYDATPDMFLLSCSRFADTRRGFTRFGRMVIKVRRLIFLLLHRPREVPKRWGLFYRQQLGPFFSRSSQ